MDVDFLREFVAIVWDVLPWRLFAVLIVFCVLVFLAVINKEIAASRREDCWRKELRGTWWQRRNRD